MLVYLKTPGTKHPMAIEYDTGEKILQGVDLDDGEGYISLKLGKKVCKRKREKRIAIFALKHLRGIKMDENRFKSG